MQYPERTARKKEVDVEKTTSREVAAKEHGRAGASTKEQRRGSRKGARESTEGAGGAGESLEEHRGSKCTKRALAREQNYKVRVSERFRVKLGSRMSIYIHMIRTWNERLSFSFEEKNMFLATNRECRKLWILVRPASSHEETKEAVSGFWSKIVNFVWMKTQDAI